tara:strand:+ start:1463 stop:2170 length:708 start_codon:yes stop_codon:yes gene_type:complete
MAIKRGPDGVPIDMPTIKHKEEPVTEATGAAKVNVDINLGDNPTTSTRASNKPSASRGLIFDDPATTPAKAPSSAQPTFSQSASALDDMPTIVGKNVKAIVIPDTSNEVTVEDPMNDPVAGWLVVVVGPGKGHFLKLGYGQNSIGRSPGERICINFGDSQISRNNHATISYDPRGNQFYIQPGSGTNMTYLDNTPTPVLQPMVLEAYSHISIGESTLRFVPLCGENFSWEKLDEN